jgi:S-adenosylmethionine hydrolase
MNFEAFFDFLNSLYFEEVEIATRTSNQERIARMVFTGNFGNDITNQQENESNTRQAMRTARCVKILGKGVVKVVHRCDDAKENHNLDLSECQLMQVPDAVYHLMRNVTLNSCNLSGNVISKIPPKFAISFNLIKGKSHSITISYLTNTISYLTNSI